MPLVPLEKNQEAGGGSYVTEGWLADSSSGEGPLFRPLFPSKPFKAEEEEEAEGVFDMDGMLLKLIGKLSRDN